MLPEAPEESGNPGGIEKNAGTQFDPQIAKLMVKLIEEGKVRCDE